MEVSLFAQRRQALMQAFDEQTAILVPAAKEQIRNRDVEHAFRQNSDFYYLTGFDEPDAILLLLPGHAEAESVLFVREKDPEKEVWTGIRAGADGAVEIAGVDAAYELDELDDQALRLIENRATLAFDWGEDDELDAWMFEAIKTLRGRVRQGVNAPVRIEFVQPVLHEQRLIKSDEEIEVLREACRITVEGHKAAMRSAMNASHEYQIQAALEAKFMSEGSPRVAFNSIVASGKNACVLHYTTNRDEIAEDALILVDAGAEFDYLSGDVTHCFPARGRFTDRQKQVYECVLAAQQAAIETVKPDVAYNEVHLAAVRVLCRGLIDMGLLDGTVETVMNTESYRQYYMHNTGHWLGMDVHDVGQYKQSGEWRILEPNMVLTVEPGLYIPEWNIGVRIEDDVRVTESGSEVLTQGLPRSVAEIEDFMKHESSSR